MPNKIYVGKISTITTEEKLKIHFSQSGTVISTQIVQGINLNQHAGYGYVTMSNDKETSDAIHKLNRSSLDGNELIVMKAHFLDQEKKQGYYRYRK